MNESANSAIETPWWLNFAKLIRFPNAFTVISNILAAQLVFGGVWNFHLLLLLPISLAFYFSGMVGNDLADFDDDKTFRPERVLPSGKISRELAMRICWMMNLSACILTVAFALLVKSLLPIFCAVALLLFVLLYNLHAKKHWYGCVVMAACRIANIYLVVSHLLPATAWNLSFQSPHLYPIGLALFVGGVTHFAANEERESRRIDLFVSMSIAVIGLSCIFLSGIRDWQGLNQQGPLVLMMLYGLMLLPVVRAAIRAVIDPQPVLVQRTVGLALRSIILLDAFVCFALYPDHKWMAVTVALLILPNFFLGRWIRST